MRCKIEIIDVTLQNVYFTVQKLKIYVIKILKNIMKLTKQKWTYKVITKVIINIL